VTATPTDRDDRPLEKGDRVRIVHSTEWRVVEGRRTRLHGQYAYVTEARQTSVSLRLEEDRAVTCTVPAHEVAIAAGMDQPELEDLRIAQSPADVELSERYPWRGRPQYSTWRIGEDEGTATLMYSSMTWELTFSERSGEFDGGEATEYDDSATGAWNAWNRMHAQVS
jgi:hypothetical protein